VLFARSFLLNEVYGGLTIHKIASELNSSVFTTCSLANYVSSSLQMASVAAQKIGLYIGLQGQTAVT